MRQFLPVSHYPLCSAHKCRLQTYQMVSLFCSCQIKTSQHGVEIITSLISLFLLLFAQSVHVVIEHQLTQLDFKSYSQRNCWRANIDNFFFFLTFLIYFPAVNYPALSQGDEQKKTFRAYDGRLLWPISFSRGRLKTNNSEGFAPWLASGLSAKWIILAHPTIPPQITPHHSRPYDRQLKMWWPPASELPLAKQAYEEFLHFTLLNFNWGCRPCSKNDIIIIIIIVTLPPRSWSLSNSTGKKKEKKKSWNYPN